MQEEVISYLVVAIKEEIKNKVKLKQNKIIVYFDDGASATIKAKNI